MTAALYDAVTAVLYAASSAGRRRSSAPRTASRTASLARCNESPPAGPPFALGREVREREGETARTSAAAAASRSASSPGDGVDFLRVRGARRRAVWAVPLSPGDPPSGVAVSGAEGAASVAGVPSAADAFPAASPSARAAALAVVRRRVEGFALVALVALVALRGLGSASAASAASAAGLTPASPVSSPAG